MIDWLIKDALIVDGTGAAPYVGDIAVFGSRILGIGKMGSIDSKGLIQAGRKIAAPGFIDMHSHSDILYLNRSCLAHKLYQGVTTELIGQDGMSVAPLVESSMEPLAEMIEPLSERLQGDWQPWDTEGFLNSLRVKTTALNVATLVGHCNLRLAVMGHRMNSPNGQELQRMKELLEVSLKQGASGLSLGLIYPPSSYSEIDELIGLARVVKDHDAVLVAHIRNEQEGIFQALEEMITIGQRTGCKVHISHLKCVGKKNWGKMIEVLGLLEAAWKEGVDLSFDQYPYTASCTSLSILLPGWALEGGWKGFEQRAGETEMIRKIFLEMRKTIENRGGPASIVIAMLESSENRGLIGMSLEKISREKEMPPEQAALELLIQEKLRVLAIYHSMREEDVERAMSHFLHTVGSDGIVGDFPHPRLYGSFPRVIHHYSQEEKLFPLEEAVRKMTSLPAKRLKLKDRGKIQEGYFADIVLFDREQFRDRATFDNPRQLSSGLEWLFVNGIPVIESGVLKERFPGQILYRESDF